MKADKIFEILDLADTARKNKFIFNPMFIGEAGLGKSEVIRQWVAQKQKTNPKFGFIDLRLAYYEGPDFVGYPHEYKDESGNTRMGHALPHFWPTEGEGLILLEEPNRGNTMVMNCLMQLLTDRMVGPNYKLPEGWIIAGAMNPEGAKYDVNNMDTALADRFEPFVVDYDFQSFMNFAESAGWHEKVLNYLKSGIWVYKTPDVINSKDGKYISPRTWSKLNAAEMSGASDHPSKQSMHHIVCRAILGKHIGNEYWKNCWDDAPVMARDLIEDKKKSIQKLVKQAKGGDTYAGDKISATVDSIIENYGGWFEGRKDANNKAWDHQEGTIDEATMVEVALVIPADLAVNLIKNCGYKVHKGQVTSYFKEFAKRNPKCVELLKSTIKTSRAVDK